MLSHSIRNLASKKLLRVRNFSNAPASAYKERKVKVLDLDINYIETLGHKENAPPIFYLPGVFGSIEMDFLPILPQLNKEKYKWIAWDPPGFGNSRPPKRDFHLHQSTHVVDVPYARELMNVLGHDRYTILAWSGAGLTGMMMAAEEPEKVPALITWAAFGKVDKNPEQSVKMAAMRKLGLAAMPEGRRKQLVNMYGEELLLEMWLGWIDQAVSMEDTETFKDNGTFKNVIQSVQCPTLVIHGGKDALISLYHADYLTANLKNSRFHLIKNGSHNLHLRETVEFVKCVEDFVDETVLRTK